MHPKVRHIILGVTSVINNGIINVCSGEDFALPSGSSMDMINGVICTNK